MSILNHIRNTFKIETFCACSTEKDVKQLLIFSPITVPTEYIEIIREKGEIEILVDNQKYVRIWGATGCIDMNTAYSIQECIPNSLAIGDDECCNVILYASGKKGFGLYIVPLDNLCLDEMVYISNSIKGFLIDGVGVQVFNHVW